MSILLEAKTSVWSNEQTDMVYCWGQQNYDFAKWLGLPARMMGSAPYAMPIFDVERGPRKHGMVIHGVNHNYMKWPTFAAALEDWDVALFVDWDLQQVRKVDANWWDRQLDLAKDAEFRAALGVQPNFTWGAWWRRFRRRRTVPKWQGTYGAQHVPYMGAFWCRSKEFIDRCWGHHLKYPVCMAQQMAAMSLDDPTDGKWIGVEEYKQRGYMADYLALKHGLEQPYDSNWIMWQNVKPRRRKRGRFNQST
jgi:hypothetical protein